MENQTTEPNYDSVMPTVPGNNLVELMTKAEIDTQITTAKQYPRSIKQFINDAMQMVTLTESIAEACNYGLPRGGKIITGPSVRFAEIVLSAWGNCRAGTRIIHEDGRFITTQGVCHDLQRNTMITMDVKRRITDKNGKTFNDDMIGVTGNAASSIALRNAILRVIPKAFWEPLYEESRRVAMGDSKTLATRRADALAVMQKYGATLEMILAKFEIKGVEDITLEHLQTLNACRNSIKAGETTVEELFAAPKPADETKGNASVKEKLAEKTTKKKPTKEEAAVAAGADPATGEITGKTTITEIAGTKGESFPDKGKEATKTVEVSNVVGGDGNQPAKPVFNTAQIKVGGKPGDATQPDFAGWRLEFMKRCNTAPSLAEISTLYKHNAGILAQIKSREASTFEECERCYNDAVDELKNAEAAMQQGNDD